MIRINFKIKFLFAIFFFFLFSFSYNSYAATLSIGANTSQVKVGDIVTATVYVNSSGESINNIEGTIQVPSNILQIQSVSTAGSIINMWVEQPSFSSSQITFNGGVTNPGYTGSSGKVMSVVLKAIQDGSANIAFNSANVRANDGLGTDVLKSKSGATVVVSTVSPVVTPVVQPVSTPVPVPVYTEIPSTTKKRSAPIITSSDSPDSETWYKNNSTTFSWNLPKGTTAVKTLFDKNSDSNPLVTYNPPIYSKKVEDIEDGIWYFHLQYQTSDGWSEVGHKKIKIDTLVPENPTVRYDILESGLVKIYLDSKEDSDISKYVFSVKGKDDLEVEFNKDGETEFVFPSTYSGITPVQITTLDQAGNSAISSIAIDFPLYNSGKETTQKTTEPAYKIWANKLIEILSVFVPIIALLALLFGSIYITVARIRASKKGNERDKRINKIEKDALALIDSLKENIVEDVHLFRADRTIENTEEAEMVLFKNLLQDFKNIEKIISTKLKRNRIPKKEISKKEDTE